MNYCEKIHYTILSTKRAEFAVMVDDLLSQLPQNEVIMRLAFFGTPGTNEEYVARRVLLREKIRRYYGDCEPALSYVSQPPLNAPLLMEVHSYVPPSAKERSMAVGRHSSRPARNPHNTDGSSPAAKPGVPRIPHSYPEYRKRPVS